MKIVTKNKYDLIIESQKEELLGCYRKIDEKDSLIIELFELRDEQNRRINELLEENRGLREKKIRRTKQ